MNKKLLIDLIILHIIVILLLLTFFSCGSGADSNEPVRELNATESTIWTMLLLCMSEPYIDVNGVEQEGVVTDLNAPEPVISLEPSCINSSTACHNKCTIKLVNPTETSLLHEMTHCVLWLFTGNPDRWHLSDYFDYTHQNGVEDFKGLDQRLCIERLV